MTSLFYKLTKKNYMVGQTAHPNHTAMEINDYVSPINFFLHYNYSQETLLTASNAIQKIGTKMTKSTYLIIIIFISTSFYK